MKYFSTVTAMYVFLLGEPREDRVASTTVSNLETTNVNTLQLDLLIGGVFSAQPYNPLNPGGAWTPHLDKKLTPPGVIVIPRLVNSEGEELKDFATLRIHRPQDFARSTEVNDDPTIIPYLKHLGWNDDVEDLVLKVGDHDDRRYLGWSDDGGMLQPWLSAELSTRHPLRTTPGADRPVTVVIEALYPRGVPDEEGDDPPTAARPSLPLRPDNAGDDVDERQAGELWLELLHEAEGSGRLARDVALVTTAPLLFPSNLEQADLIVASHISVPTSQQAFTYADNVGFIVDVRDIAAEAGVAFHAIPRDLQTIDRWAQDQAFYGYFRTPEAVRHVVVKAMRKKHLQTAMSGYAQTTFALPSEQIGLFDRLYALRKRDDSPHKDQHGSNSLNFGGNLLVSPPVLGETKALDGGFDGPAVPAHPPAPYGKLILGDRGAFGGSPRRPAAIFRSFLSAQKVQPVLPIDASWLAVGHVDELMSFVPARRVCPYTGVGAKGWAMLFASSDLALLLMALARPMLKRPWRVAAEEAKEEAFLPELASEEQMDELLEGYQQVSGQWSRLDRGLYAFQDILDQTEDRLSRGLLLDPHRKDTVLAPVLYSHIGRGQFVSELPNPVNLVVLNDHVLVPKPWGPRVKVEHAADIVSIAFKELGLGTTPASFFTHGNVVDALLTETIWICRDPTTYPEANLEWNEPACEDVAEALSPGDDTVTARVDKPGRYWMKVRVRHQDSVDVFEAYLLARLASLGLHVHFVDDWPWYHLQKGDVHCATNVRRRPHDVPPEHAWWMNFERCLATRDYQ